MNTNTVGEANNASELWQFLIKTGGLDPKGYDSYLVSELRKRLDLPSNLSVINALKRSNPSINTFIEAFFQSAKPYVRMWAELLSLYEKAAATQGSDNLRILYNFNEDSKLESLDFDLEHFRQILRMVELMMAPFDLSAINQHDFWAISEPFRGSDNCFQIEPPTDFLSFCKFVSECRKGIYPPSMPNLPAIDDERLASLLQEVWELANVVRRDLREHFGSYQALCEVRNVDDEPLSCGLSKRVLQYTEHDHWLPTLISSILTKYADWEKHDWSAIADQLNNALEKFRNQDANLRTPMERLEEFLQLPVWKFRYDLYSNWICAVVIHVLDDQEPLVHSSNGTIVFSFGGTHLATFDRMKPRIHLWTELRTPLENPVGKGRASNIQPDIVLRRDPLTAGINPVVVECKQYKKANNRAFGEALTDYANGHLNALIILADYGPVKQESVLKYVPPKLHERTVVVSDLHPAHKEGVKSFQTILRKGLKLNPLSDDTSAVVGKLELTWNAKLRDLDLHLLIEAPKYHVFYDNRGSLEEEPFVLLENDDTEGNGHEVMRIKQWFPTYYKVEVHNYSKEGSLGISSAVVTLEVDGKLYQYPCPKELQSEVWTVCRINGATLQVNSC